MLVTMVDFVTVGLSCGVRSPGEESEWLRVLLGKHMVTFYRDTCLHARVSFLRLPGP